MPEPAAPVRIAILISGRGSNMLALVNAWKGGRILGGEIVCVVSDKADAPGLTKAAELGVATHALPRQKGEAREAHDARMRALLEGERIDLVCLAGYMRRLSAELVRAFPDRILNIHPSLLPAFPGLDAQRQAFEHGAKVTGATVHVVDEELDHGPIVAQLPVTIWEEDTVETLAARILEKEHRIYPTAVSLYCQGRLKIVGRRVEVLGGGRPAAANKE